MNFREITPGPLLQPYVRSIFIYEAANDLAFDDTVLPSGCTEIIFNLGSGHWQTHNGEAFVNTPPVELWGQLVRPFVVRSLGRNIMLGVRFYPHAVAAMLPERIDQFNNQVYDGSDVFGNAIHTLHAQLLDISSWKQRVHLVETFLLQQLSLAGKRLPMITLVHDMMSALRRQEPFETMDTIASRYGITARYMQQLFVQNTGLTPKSYSQINRFQKSLQLVTANEMSLTAVAYECGYADQSHFIREFKAFAGTTPSGYAIAHSPLTQAVNLSPMEPANV
jgi:AraC-like DNA-binding protein